MLPTPRGDANPTDSSFGSMERSDDHLGRGRKLGVRIAAVVGLLLFLVFFGVVAADTVGLIDPSAVGSPDDPPPSAAARYGAAHPGDAVHAAGAISVLALGAWGLLALIAWPERSGAAYQVLAVTVGVLITLPIVGDPNNVGGQAGWIDPLLAILVVPSLVTALLASPWRARSSGPGRPRLLLLAAIVAVPAAWYGVDQALLQRDTFPPTADPHHNAHWWVMATSAAMTVLVVAAAGLPRRRWPWGAVIAGAAAVAVGVASIADQGAASALAIGWALPAVVWGAVTAWLALRTDRREAASS
jgi:hypothetical protein